MSTNLPPSSPPSQPPASLPPPIPSATPATDAAIDLSILSSKREDQQASVETQRHSEQRQPHRRSIPQPLPPALQPWHAWLQWFPHDSALAIGGLLPRLHAAMGQYRGTLQRGAHTPNGIDELRRRGPYHRLLLSEWMMADEMPDEFLRRASSGEHLFLSPRYETIKADAQLIAVFDGGPAQFGAPRLAHVAMWILLARRAEQAGIGFRWGLLDAPGVFDDGGDAQALKRMLIARSLQHPDRIQVEAWRDALAADPCRGGERWLIAGAREDAEGFSHRVRVARDLQSHLQVRQLQVRIASTSGTRDVEVPLPPAKASARLLRGAFAFEVANVERLVDSETFESTEKLSLRQPPLIGQEGRHIAVPILGESAAMVYAMTSPRQQQRGQTPKTKLRKMQWASGSDLLCAALSRKQFGGVIADTSHLFFWQLDGFHTQPRPPKEQLQAPPGQAHWLSCLWFNSGSRPYQLFILDHARRLTMFATKHPDGEASEMRLIDEHVIAIARHSEEELVYLRYRTPSIELIQTNRRGWGSQRLSYATLPLSPQAPDQGFLHRRTRHAGAWCVRAQRGAGEDSAAMWTLYGFTQGDQTAVGQPVSVAAGWQVVGLIPVPNTPSEYGLVAIAANRKRLVLLRGNGHDTLYASARSITAASVGTDCDLIALITEDRKLVVLTPGGEHQQWNVDATEDGDD
jgi:hypothetical protein